MRASLPRNAEELLQNRRSTSQHAVEALLSSSSSSDDSSQTEEDEADSEFGGSSDGHFHQDRQRSRGSEQSGSWRSGDHDSQQQDKQKRHDLDSDSSCASSSSGIDEFAEADGERSGASHSEDFLGNSPTLMPSEDREFHMDSQEEDMREVKQTFHEILVQIKAHGEERRVQRIRHHADKLRNSNDQEPILRSVNASVGNRFELGTEKLHAAYLSLVRDKVLTYRDKYTGMSLAHYACEFGCTRFLRSIAKGRSLQALLQMICAPSRNGRTGLHMIAQNHGSSDLSLLLKVVKRLCSRHQLGTRNSQQHEESKGPSSVDGKALYQHLIDTLKASDHTQERNTVLHTAFLNEYRLPEELSIDFEEEYELSESHYGHQPARTRRANRKFELEYSIVKRGLKEAFLLKLLALYGEIRLTAHVFKQLNASHFCPLELALSHDHFPILKKMLRMEPSLVHLQLGNQNSLLHLAALQGKTRVVRFLLTRTEIDHQSLNLFGQTPFTMAFHEGNLEVCELMREHFTSKDESGEDRGDSEAFLNQQLYQSTNRSASLRNSEGFSFKDVFVHVDLKGAPPLFDFLIRFIEFVASRFENLVTGFVFEFEDMFPFEGHLKCIASPKAYSRQQIQYLAALLKRKKLKTVVLVQTFGHLEFVLKRSRFADYREQVDNPISVCSLRQGAMELIGSLISQVVDGFGGQQNIDYLHIGADEVFNFATCRECKLFAQQASEKLLYSRWITKVLKWVRRRYPSLEVMAWDDMFRQWQGVDLELLQIPQTMHESQQRPQNTRRKHILQPCVWVYAGQKDAFEMTVSESQLNTTCLEFKRVWVASAYQGAKEPSACWTDFEQRLHNHRLWLDRLQNSIYKQTYREAISGIILTGWTRFTHQSVLCEMMPMTIPSLSLCLMIIENRQFNLEALYSQLVDMLHLQPRKLMQPVDTLYGQSSLRDFVRDSPWMRRSRRNAKMQFCNDAFEIAWILNKGQFLLTQVETTMRDWSCANIERQIMETLKRKAYPRLMHYELSHLLISSRASRQQQTMLAQQAKVAARQGETRSEEGRQAQKQLVSVNQLKDSDSMELDDLTTQEYELPLPPQAPPIQRSDSIETNSALERLRLLTSSSDENSTSIVGTNTVANEFDFEDRIYGTLRTQFYKQLRGCVKLFRRALLLCEKVLPQYLHRSDIEEFKNSKVLSHLLKAYQLQQNLFAQNYVAATPVQSQTLQQQQERRVQDVQGRLGLGASPWRLPESVLQHGVAMLSNDRKRKTFAFRQQQQLQDQSTSLPFSSMLNTNKFRIMDHQPAQIFPLLQKTASVIQPAAGDQVAKEELQQERPRFCQTPDSRPQSGSPLLLIAASQQKVGEQSNNEWQQTIMSLQVKPASNEPSLHFLEDVPLKTSLADLSPHPHHHQQAPGTAFLECQIQSTPLIEKRRTKSDFSEKRAMPVPNLSRQRKSQSPRMATVETQTTFDEGRLHLQQTESIVFKSTHAMPSFAVPRNKVELLRQRQRQQHHVEDSPQQIGCEANISKRRKEKILRKRHFEQAMAHWGESDTGSESGRAKDRNGYQGIIPQHQHHMRKKLKKQQAQQQTNEFSTILLQDHKKKSGLTQKEKGGQKKQQTAD